MQKIITVAIFIILAADILFAVWLLLHGKNIAVLNPMGYITHRELDLILTSLLLMLVVVIPVFILLFTVACRYRAGNTKANYAPECNNILGWQNTLYTFPSI